MSFVQVVLFCLTVPTLGILIVDIASYIKCEGRTHHWYHTEVTICMVIIICFVLSLTQGW